MIFHKAIVKNEYMYIWGVDSRSPIKLSQDGANFTAHLSVSVNLFTKEAKCTTGFQPSMGPRLYCRPPSKKTNASIIHTLNVAFVASAFILPRNFCF